MIEKRLFQEIKPYKRQWIMIAVWQTFIGIFTILFAYYLAKIMAGVVFSAMMLREVVPFFMVLLFAVCGRAFCRWKMDCTAYFVAVRVQEEFKGRLLRHFCFALGPVGLANEKSGELYACLVDGVEALEDFFTKFIPLCFSVVIMMPLILAAALPEDFFSAMIFLVTAPLIPVFMFLIGKRAQTANSKQWHTLAKLSADFLDLLEGMTLLKIFNQAHNRRQEVESLSEMFRDSTMKVLRVAFLSAFVLELIATLSIALVAVSLGLRLLSGETVFGQALFVLLLAPEFYQPLRQLGGAFHQAMASGAAATRIYEILDRPAALWENKHGKRLEEGAMDISFDHVSFSYEGDRDGVLQRLCFTAPAGKQTAIVGLSGAGKSTVFQLLLGFAKPQEGNVFFDKNPLSSLHMASLRRRIAYLPQEPHLFSMSIAENIALCDSRASREEIIMAAKQAKIHSFIMGLPEGYETKLGDGGRMLSGGQRQRIAIARAFLQKADMILLDELYAGLDAVAIRQVAEALRFLTEGKTVLIITHDLRQAARADQIVVMENGRAVECGTHEDLMKKSGVYVSLWENGEGQDDVE